MVAIHDRGAETIFARQRELPVLDVEEAAEIAGIHTLREELVAEAKIQSEPVCDFPIVLHEAAGVKGALPAPIEHRGHIRCFGRWVSEQEVRERQTRPRRIRTGSEG